MFQEGVQIPKLHGDYGVHAEPSLRGRRMKISPKLSPHAESRDSSKNQGTCPRPELSPQATKRKIEHPWPDQASGSAVGQDSSWPASSWQAASSLPDHARPQVPWDVSSSWQAASSWQVSLSQEPSWQQSCNSRPAYQVPVAWAPRSTFSGQGSSHQDPNWHEPTWQTFAPSPMSSNWQAANYATADTQNPANARIRAQHNANKFQTHAAMVLVQLRQRLQHHSDQPNAFRKQADNALMQLGNHLHQNSPAEVLARYKFQAFESIRDFHKFDFYMKGKKDPGAEAEREALDWVSQVIG